MEKYKDFIIYKGKREIGLMWADIKRYLLTPNQYEKFNEWMTGQTCGGIEHVSDDGTERYYVPIVYVDDYLRFIKGLPVID